ncbi:hypothetical protein CXB51_017444 [Gossypium anomalum]|uniref:Aminotransferase-like plant mobile domain-containing protein n=1 Tax=Gossypium anomalum TaxID=47600 RepID=A0A8J5YT42_9ROSI|nr:hypothetical protein CXB51_017444 [Gossypium anomalum]
MGCPHSPPPTASAAACRPLRCPFCLHSTSPTASVAACMPPLPRSISSSCCCTMLLSSPFNGKKLQMGDLISMAPQTPSTGREKEERERRRKKRRREEEEERKKKDLQEMGSLINNNNHISSTINEMGPYRVLRGRVNSVGFFPDERLIPYLELAEFGSAALIQTFDLRYDLIFALVERWRPETHTFHLSYRECTITLEDVALQLGLPIDGNVVTSVSSISRPTTFFYELLGRLPSEEKFTSLRFSWLKANFEHFPSTANEWKVMQTVRAYIMHLIGGVLMPDTNDSMVHLMYLPLLSNLHNTRSYSWGSAVLVMLYRELCRTTDPSVMDIGGCLILLQLWALYRMPFLASISHQSYIFPFRTNPGIGRSYAVPIYRLMIENHAGKGFIWISYSVSEIMASIPSSAHVHSNLWCISAPVINFHIVEWRGTYGNDWGEVYEEYITMWNNRLGRVPQIDRALDLQPSLEYIQWYCEIGKPFLFGGRSMSRSQSRNYTLEIVLIIQIWGAMTISRAHQATNIIQSLISSAHYHISTPVIPARIHLSTLLLSARIHSHTPLLPARIHRHTPFLLARINRHTPLLPAQVHRWRLRHDFSPMFRTPPHTDEENVDRRNHPQRERRAPQKYTPRTTPSNHQF